MVKKKQTNKTVKKQDIFVSVVVGVDRNYIGLGEYLTDLSKLLGGSYENYEIIVIDNELKPEVAKEVIQGNWGNGELRRARLENAGYNYEEVQKEVNRLLKSK